MSDVSDQLASGHAGLLYLVEMQFTTGTLRVTNWGHSVDVAGQTWSALGVVTSITTISESERLEYPALELGMNVANESVLSLALGAVSTYRNRPITVYQVVLDDDLRPMGEPEIAWAGVMDQVRIKTGDGDKEEGAVAMRCEIPGRDSRAAQSLRLNNAQQQARYPGDTGLSRMERLSGQPTTWLSKKFQKV